MFKARSRVADLLTAQGVVVMYGCKASSLSEMGLREMGHALLDARNFSEALLPMLGPTFANYKNSGSVSRDHGGGVTLAIL